MKISFERTGGFAGLRMAAVIDTDDLSEEEANRLRDLVSGADFFALPARIINPTAVPDQFQYTITVEVERLRHTVETGDNPAPETLRPLLEQLSRRARARRMG